MSAACLLLCGLAAGSAVWAATHAPDAAWCAEAELVLRNLEAHSPGHPKLHKLRADLDRLKGLLR